MCAHERRLQNILRLVGVVQHPRHESGVPIAIPMHQRRKGALISSLSGGHESRVAQFAHIRIDCTDAAARHIAAVESAVRQKLSRWWRVSPALRRPARCAGVPYPAFRSQPYAG